MNKKRQLPKVVAQVEGYRIRQDERGFAVYNGKHRFLKLKSTNVDDAINEAKDLIK